MTALPYNEGVYGTGDYGVGLVSQSGSTAGGGGGSGTIPYIFTCEEGYTLINEECVYTQSFSIVENVNGYWDKIKAYFFGSTTNITNTTITKTYQEKFIETTETQIETKGLLDKINLDSILGIMIIIIIMVTLALLLYYTIIYFPIIWAYTIAYYYVIIPIIIVLVYYLNKIL